MLELIFFFFFFKQKTAYEMRTYWSSDVCSSDLGGFAAEPSTQGAGRYRRYARRSTRRSHGSGGNGRATVLEADRQHAARSTRLHGTQPSRRDRQIGRASCRERV